MNSNSNNIVIIRYDSGLYHFLEQAKEAEERFKQIVIIPEYNTVMKVEGGYVITNKFDPRCNDKITPVTPGFTNEAIRSS